MNKNLTNLLTVCPIQGIAGPQPVFRFVCSQNGKFKLTTMPRTHTHTHMRTLHSCVVYVFVWLSLWVCVCVCSLRFLVVCHWLRLLCRLCRLSVNHRRCTAHGNQFVFGCVTRCVLHAVARQSPLRVWTKERESSIENLSNIFWTNNLKWCARHCDCQFFTIYFLCFNKHQNEWIEMHKLCEWTKCNQFMQFQ